MVDNSSLPALEAKTSLLQDRSTDKDEPEAERDDSRYQVLWSGLMEKGKYKNPSTYTKVHVLLLCWEKNSDDLGIEEEVQKLKSVFERRFFYNTKIKLLCNNDKKSPQVQANQIIANFVGDYDAQNTLLIVYYAGHGRPGESEGHLELHGQTSPNDKQKRSDSLIWNFVEDLLTHGQAHILEIFDCCYAGTLGFRGDQKSFEYLAATTETGLTPVPGPTSFTSALVWALESLVNDKPGGRFTTLELWKKIKQAPSFPEKQIPVVFNQLHKHGSVGHIILHPLTGEGSSTQISQTETNGSDYTDHQTVTLLFDFGQKPTPENIEVIGNGLNKMFEQNTLGVHGVRWGGMQQTPGDRAAKRFRDFVRLIMARSNTTTTFATTTTTTC